MKPKDSKQELTKFVKKSGARLPALMPAEGLPLMLDFYQRFGAKGCPFDADGDMLLYQWGVYDDSTGGHHCILTSLASLFSRSRRRRRDESLSLTFS